MRDRVVQMLLKMLMEPIWESDFLDCSSGFRPGRRTMDCLAMCYRLIQAGPAYFWVVEGDIVACFEHPSCYSVPVPAWSSVGGISARTRSSVAGSSGKR